MTQVKDYQVQLCVKQTVVLYKRAQTPAAAATIASWGWCDDDVVDTEIVCVETEEEDENGEPIPGTLQRFRASLDGDGKLVLSSEQKP
jgi:hypothetical protein